MGWSVQDPYFVGLTLANEPFTRRFVPRGGLNLGEAPLGRRFVQLELVHQYPPSFFRSQK